MTSSGYLLKPTNGAHRAEGVGSCIIIRHLLNEGVETRFTTEHRESTEKNWLYNWNLRSS